ncbi:nudix hydrolase 2 isoform X1 [Hevea brasiliensis]|uniref:nudix hydrolase 2 isoform X1 n=1 Tax=Hevea brasiliensis TaxID=3981 RepID=UPI0025D3597D|nr:nudix hydrolase 2 isoform X1 [Hevea brasiliensis]
MVESVSFLGNSVPIENGVNHVKLLPASNDDHGGVIVDMKEPVEPDIFLAMLRASISLWRQQGKRGVWIKLPIKLVNLVETAVKEGFWYHHAEPSYLMLVYWIPETASTIPANASHRVGVGAIVFNDKREVLVVQEKSGRFRGTGVWKIPTGVVDEGEDVFMAAVREVKEETGIDTDFQEILAFRQSHKSFFGKSDLFFLCFLRPLSFDIQKQELEIEAAQVISGSSMRHYLLSDSVFYLFITPKLLVFTALHKFSPFLIQDDKHLKPINLSFALCLSQSASFKLMNLTMKKLTGNI